MVLFFFLLFGVFLSQFSLAAEPQPEEALPPVFVTSTRLKDVEEEAFTLPQKVIVITADQIEQLGAKTIQEALQYQTGIVLYDEIGNDFQSTVDMRGFNGQPVPNTSVFVDGVRVNEPDFNIVNFDLIPIESIDRIEILPGTATIFGRDALGGVINIITKRGRGDETPHFSVDLGGGSFGRQRYTFTTGGPLPLPNFDYYFGVTRELTDGFRDASGGRITRLLGKLGYRFGDDTDATLTYTHVQDHLKQAGSLPDFLLHLDRDGNFTPGDFSASDLNLVTLNVRQKLPAGFSVALNGFLRSNDQQGFVVGQFSSQSTLIEDILSVGGTLQGTQEGIVFNKKNLLTLGVEYAHNRFSITNAAVFPPFPPSLTMQIARENVLGVYLSDSFNLFESLILNAGFRYDLDNFDFTDQIDPTLNSTKSYNQVSPKVGVVYVPFKNVSLFFNYSQGIRMPTVSEIFAQGPFGSNPNLLPMRSQNFEIGAKARFQDWLDGSLNLFYTPVRDEILFVVTDPVTFTGQNENICCTLRKGIEATLRARYGQWVDGFLNYTATKATFETNVLLFSGQVRKGDELPLVPRNRVGMGVNVHPIDKLTLSLFGTYVGSAFLLNDEPNQGKKLAEYFVLNSRIAYEWRNWQAYVTINNLTNRKYSTFGILSTQPFFVPAPRTNAFAGITFRY